MQIKDGKDFQEVATYVEWLSSGRLPLRAAVLRADRGDVVGLAQLTCCWHFLVTRVGLISCSDFS
jgi:hypothetical protein